MLQRRKLNHFDTSILKVPQFTIPSLHDPEYITSKLAKSIVLDLNDPQLLVDEDRSAMERPRNHLKRADLTKGGRAAFSKGLSQRYNISNDEAYDLLKENHQSKVRSTLGNVAVSHSMPALRLQWPYVSFSQSTSADWLLTVHSIRPNLRSRKRDRSIVQHCTFRKASLLCSASHVL